MSSASAVPMSIIVYTCNPSCPTECVIYYIAIKKKDFRSLFKKYLAILFIYCDLLFFRVSKTSDDIAETRACWLYIIKISLEREKDFQLRCFL